MSPKLTSTSPPSNSKRSSAEAGPPGREQPEASSGPLLRAFFSHAVIAQTIETLFEAVTAGSGTILLTGDSGTGKTMMVKQLEGELRAAACTVVGFNGVGPLGSDDLVRTLSNELGIALPGGQMDRWLKSFEFVATKHNTAGAPIVLVIDGAERLSGDLRSLLGQLMNAATEPSGLRLILAGRPEILGHAELQHDHDLGRSIRADLRLERRIDKDLASSSVASPAKAGHFGEEVTTEAPSSEPASESPSERTPAARTRLPTEGSAPRWSILGRRRSEPSQDVSAPSTGRIRAARLLAVGCVVAGGIGFAAVAGRWLVAEMSRSSTNSPAGYERVAGPVSSGVRGSSTAPIGDPVEVAQSEFGLAPDLASGEPRRSGAVRLPDETLAAVLSRGDEIHGEDVRFGQIKGNPPPSASPAPAEQGLAHGESTSADAPSDAAPTIAPETASIGGTAEPARSETGSAMTMLSGEGEGRGAVRLPDDIVAAFLKRGDELLALGDLSAARLLYERAAMAGSARAATAAGKTYDPIFVRDSDIRGARSDAAKALAWYRKAIELGDSEAAARLKSLVWFAGQ